MSLIAMAAGAALFLQQSAGTQPAAAEAARLEACVEKIETAPEEAYEDGLAWSFAGNRPGARQCTALALIALGNVEEGAVRLENLSMSSDGGTLEQRAVYLSQAGNAWLQIGAAEAAAVSFSEALRLAPGENDLLLDRASAYMVIDKWDEAMADLNAVIANSPGDAIAYQMRAEIHLNKDALDLAMKDVETSMAADPRNIDTLLVRGRVREAMRIKAGN
jgi:tetratricopeptide (TPR) repeat protein